MKLSIGVAILALSTIGTAQSPTFTRTEVGQSFMCGKLFGMLTMGIDNEDLEIKLKSAYVDHDCLTFQDIGEGRPWTSTEVKK